MTRGCCAPMSSGMATTFEVLARTDNEAAVRVLVAALDSPDPDIRQRAVEAILLRRRTGAGLEILRRLDRFGARERAIVARHPNRLGRALRDALVGDDDVLRRRACLAAVEFDEYDLLPTLLAVVESRTGPAGELAAWGVLELAQKLYEALFDPSAANQRHSPRMIHHHVVVALEEAVRRFAQHRRQEVIEALLLLCGPDNATLRQLLDNPLDPAFRPIVSLLSTSQRGGVIRLLLAFLDDTRAPGAVINILANRADERFLRHLLRKLNREITPAAAQNLKRIRGIPWLRDPRAVLDRLDESAEVGAVRLVIGSGIPRDEAFEAIRAILVGGRPPGRREAARALAEFQGAQANALALRALDDPDPEVQANVVRHLRQRSIPGAVARLVAMLESPHAVVRRAVRQSLTELNFRRYLSAFDMLDEEVRRTTGLLVRKVDPQTIPLLRDELCSKMRNRRYRALRVAAAIDALGPLEDEIVALLRDEDHLIRAEAASLLAGARSPAAQRALVEAAQDRSETVREAARSSLKELREFTEWRDVLVDPRD